MWRIVCVGPSPMDRVRRIEDRGPLHPDQGRAHSIAEFLRATGLYESVTVVGSSVKAAAIASLDMSSVEATETKKSEQSLDDLSAALDEPAAEAT